MNSDVSVCSKTNTSSKKPPTFDKIHSENNEIINYDVTSHISKLNQDGDGKAMDEGDGFINKNNIIDENNKFNTNDTTDTTTTKSSSLFTAILMKPSTKLSRITPIDTPSISSDTTKNSPLQKLIFSVSNNSPKWAPFGRRYSSKIDRIV